MEYNQNITSGFSNASQNIVQTQDQFCSEKYVHFFHEYDKFDHQLKVFVGGLGFVANLINIFVFTRREMRNQLNTILLALAVADGLFLLTVFVANSFMWIHLASIIGSGNSVFGGNKTPGLYWKTSHSIAVVYTVYTNFYYFFHYCTIYLMILVALWRMLGITFPLKSRRWLTARVASCGILGAVFIAFVTTATYFVPIEIQSATVQSAVAGGGTRAVTFYFPAMSLAAENFMYWTYAICIKIIPSLLLSIFTVVLLVSLVRAKKGRREMMIANSTSTQTSQEIISRRGETKAGKSSASASSSSFDRTTKLLLTLVLIFLLTETPDALLTILYVSIKNDSFVSQCLAPPVLFLMTLECVSSFSSFFIYLGKSTPFRNILLKLFKC